jgi:hypothetical protein
MDTRTPENLLTFFSTDEPWTHHTSSPPGIRRMLHVNPKYNPSPFNHLPDLGR